LKLDFRMNSFFRVSLCFVLQTLNETDVDIGENIRRLTELATSRGLSLNQFLTQLQQQSINQPAPGAGHENRGNDDDDVSVSENAIWPTPLRTEQVLSRLEPDPTSHLPSFPSLNVKTDIDSVYKTSRTLANLIDDIGRNNRFTLNSVTTAYSSDQGSRFCVNSDNVNDPPYVRSNVAKTVPLHWFPNIKIGTARIKEWGYDMHIHLYFLGIEKFTKEARFSRLWISVVNAMLNMARQKVVSDADTCYNEMLVQECQNMYPFESKAGSQEWTRTVHNYRNHLNFDAMKVFASKMEEALELIATNNSDWKFEDPELNGIRLEDMRSSTVPRGQMVSFAKSLRKSICFTASIAGCKDYFVSRKEFNRIILSPEDSELEDLKERYTEEATLYISTHPEYDLDDNLPPYSLFPDLLDEWKDKLDQAICTAISGTEESLHDSFRSAFDSDYTNNEGPDGQWFVDVGMEIRFDVSSSTSLFADVKTAQATLTEVLALDRDTTVNPVYPTLTLNEAQETSVNAEQTHLRSLVQSDGDDDLDQLYDSIEDNGNVENNGQSSFPGETAPAFTNQFDMDPFDLISADRDIKPSVWEQLATHKGVGGVHSGKIMLFLIEDNDGNRFLVESRLVKEFSGGQIYVPMTKKFIKKVSISKNKDIPSLPAMLQSIMSEYNPAGNAKNQTVLDRVRRCIKQLDDIYKTARNEIQNIHKTNSCRFEFFCYSSTTGEFSFPRLEYTTILLHSSENIFMHQYTDITQEIMVPLFRTFIMGNPRSYLDLSEETKGMLLVCTEMAVKLTELHPFEGRLMKRISTLAETDHYQWYIPRNLLKTIKRSEADATGLEFGVSPSAMALTIDISSLSTARPTGNDQHIRSLPVFAQMYQQCLSLGVQHPLTFLKSQVKMVSWIWHTIDEYKGKDENYSPPARSVFRRPNFKQLMKCSADSFKELMESWCKIICNAYDFEWFSIFKKKMQLHFLRLNRTRGQNGVRRPVIKKLEDFPVTVKQLDTFVSEIGEIDIQIELGKDYTYKRNSAQVRNTDDFIAQISYSLCTVPQPNCNQWKMSLTRNLCLLVVHMIRESQTYSREPKRPTVENFENKSDLEKATITRRHRRWKKREEVWNVSNFQKVLSNTFASEWRKKDHEDSTECIIWRTTPSQQYRNRYDSNHPETWQIRPMILKVDTEVLRPSTVLPGSTASLPAAASAVTVAGETVSAVSTLSQPSFNGDLSFPYSHLSDSKNFFLNNFMKSGNVDVVNILRVRVFMYLRNLHHDNPKFDDIKALIYDVQLTNTVYLHSYMVTKDSHRRGCIRTWKSHSLDDDSYMTVKPESKKTQYEVIQAAKWNSDRWRTRDEHGIKLTPASADFRSLFQYDDTIQQEADHSLMLRGVRGVRHHAARGIITPSFLDAAHQKFIEVMQVISLNPSADLKKVFGIAETNPAKRKR